MLATQATIDVLAERIERVYLLRHPQWYRGCSSPGVWTTAASLLYRVHTDNPEMPLDPELYVAVQPISSTFADPWAELTEPVAARRYQCRVRQMVRGLQSELRGEVQRAEGRVRRGEAMERVLLTKHRSLSPLGCLIVAVRAGRTDLAVLFRPEVIDQHRSCPLYRQAIHRLFPEYSPLVESITDHPGTPAERHRQPQVNLN